MADPRPAAQRKADTLALLSAYELDAWVASGGGSLRAHLVPLSMAWDGDRVILATEPSSLTARNIVSSRRGRLGAGATRDVVMIDVRLESVCPVGSAGADVGDAWAAQNAWDPRADDGDFVFLVLRPWRIQAWREANEIEGRTLTRGGRWLV